MQIFVEYFVILFHFSALSIIHFPLADNVELVIFDNLVESVNR